MLAAFATESLKGVLISNLPLKSHLGSSLKTHLGSFRTFPNIKACKSGHSYRGFSYKDNTKSTGIRLSYTANNKLKHIVETYPVEVGYE